MKKIFLLLCLPVFSFAQWTQTQGPFTGWIGEIVQYGNEMYVGASTGFYSKPINGNNWMQNNQGLGSTFIHAIVKHNNNLFVGTDGGVFKSTNNGVQWSQSNSSITTQIIYCMASDQTSIYAGTYNGLFKSTNNGSTWVNISAGLLNTTIHSLFVNGNDLWAGTGNYAYLSTDGGVTWTVKDGNIQGSFYHEFHDFTIMNNQIFAATNFGVFKSINNGGIWVPVNIGLPIFSTSIFPSTLEIANDGINLFVGTTFSGIYKSTNNGATWLNSNNEFINSNDSTVTALAVINNTIYVGSDKYGGLQKSTNNGGNWTADNVGLIANTYCGEMASNDSILFANVLGVGLFASKTQGNSWTKVGAGLNYTNAHNIECSGNFVFVSELGANVSVSNNNGQLFTPIFTSILPNGNYSFCKNGADLYAGKDLGNFYKSTNNGVSWTLLGNNPVAIYESIIMVGSDIYFSSLNQIYISTNNGLNFINSNTGIPGNSTVVKLVKYGNSKLLAATTQGCFASTNGGVTWFPSYNGIATVSIEDMVADFANGKIYCSSAGKVFQSFDGGNTWSIFSAGLPNDKFIRNLNLKNGILFGAEELGSGIWKVEVDASVGINDLDKKQPIKVYPNPILNYCSIECSKEELGKKFIILDSKGVLIKQGAFDQPITTIKTDNWPIGVYHLQVEAQLGFSTSILKQ